MDKNPLPSARTLLALLSLAGCASEQQFLDGSQAAATQTALSRGRFEMNCQEVTPTLLSKEVVQPALQGPWVGGIQRAEYTIGVSGCGKRTTFIVICPEGGDGCFAAGPGRFHGWQEGRAIPQAVGHPPGHEVAGTTTANWLGQRS